MDRLTASCLRGCLVGSDSRYDSPQLTDKRLHAAYTRSRHERPPVHDARKLGTPGSAKAGVLPNNNSGIQACTLTSGRVAIIYF